MKELTDNEASVIDSFLAEHWSLFEEHCEEQGVEADEVAEKLS